MKTSMELKLETSLIMFACMPWGRPFYHLRSKCDQSLHQFCFAGNLACEHFVGRARRLNAFPTIFLRAVDGGAFVVIIGVTYSCREGSENPGVFLRAPDLRRERRKENERFSRIYEARSGHGTSMVHLLEDRKSFLFSLEFFSHGGLDSWRRFDLPIPYSELPLSGMGSSLLLFSGGWLRLPPLQWRSSHPCACAPRCLDGGAGSSPHPTPTRGASSG